MISAKLRGLQALAPLTLDGSIFRHLSPPSWQPPVIDNASDKKPTRLTPLFRPVSFEVRKPPTLPVSTPLLLTVWKNDKPAVNFPVHVEDKSVQTDCHTESGITVKAVSEKLADAFHKLNTWECQRFTTETSINAPSDIGKRPAVWFALGELGYSPALFNLGVWYERRAAACLTSKSSNRSKYESKAEQMYKRAVLIDGHPIAAYNLACLLQRTARTEVQIGDRTRSITDLMKLASDGGLESANKFIQK